MDLFVAKLNPSTTTKDLQKLFAHYGFVTSVKIIMDRNTGKSKGYGFIEMPDNHEADEAVKELDSTLFQEAVITVRKSQPTRLPAQKNVIQYATNRSARILGQHEYLRDTTTNPTFPQNNVTRRNFGYRGGSYKRFD